MTSEIGPVYFLLVDDLEENLLSLEGLLRRDGLVLLKARSGTEALEFLLTHDVALAILDVQMPEMDGYELAELMRGTERTRRVPIILLTAGAADRQRRFRGYEAGAVDFLNKPIESDILRSKAGVFFELYQQRHKIAAQRDELKSYAEALTEADRRKDEFLATLAHELRNPLAPIRNGLDILRASPTAENAEEIRDMMDRQLSHLVRLVDDLLDVSRVSKGKIELRKAHIALSEVVRTAVDASNPLIAAGRHELTVDLPDDPVWLDADLMRLSQVVSNLLNNAAKYTPEGGAILVSARREGGEVVIIVSDNGVGIPADMLPLVFDLFTQVRDNLHRSHGGLGIGLALVKQLVEMHGGAIVAESPGPGKGSAFRVRLPLAQSAQASSGSDEPLSSPAPNTNALKVLVVDDNFDVAQTVGWMLETIGHDYRMVHEGKLAIEAALDYRPDAILLDIGMPGMDGYAVCRALREQRLFDDTVIIAQTGWGQAQAPGAPGEPGFDHHLVKPVNLERLEQLLADVSSARPRDAVGA
jgi:signal transduction histidine kinase